MAENKVSGSGDAAAKAAAERAAKQAAEKAAAAAAQKAATQKAAAQIKTARPSAPSAQGMGAHNGVSAFDDKKKPGLAVPKPEVTRGVTPTMNGADAEIQAEVKAGPVTASVRANASVETSRKEEDGKTTISLETKASVTASIGADFKQGSISAEHSEGVTARVEVTAPTDKLGQLGDVRNLNPLDPSGLPAGTRVTMDSSRNSDTTLTGTFKGLSVETNSGTDKGVTLQVDKLDDNRVRVTAGPTEAMRQGIKFGANVGDVTASVGASQTLGQERLKTAEFDLSTPEGKSAYQDLVTKGQFPTQEGPGVSNVATVDKVKYEHSLTADVTLGNTTLWSGSGNTTEASLTRTSKPDGSYTLQGDIQHPGNVPLQITAQYDAQGKEKVDERKYEFTLEVKTSQQANQLIMATTGRPATRDELREMLVKPGEKTQSADPIQVKVSFNEDQMKQLRQQSIAASRNDPLSTVGLLTQAKGAYGTKFEPVANSTDLAVRLSEGTGNGRMNTDGFLTHLNQIRNITGQPVSAQFTH